MNDTSDTWSLLLGLQHRALAAASSSQLTFLIANETWHLVPYRQALVFTLDVLGRPTLQSVSGLVSTLEDTPFTLWVTRTLRAVLDQNAGGHAPHRLTAQDLPQDFRQEWAEWWPEFALLHPLITPGGQCVGHVIYLRESPWQDNELELLKLLHAQYAYCLATFKPRSSWLRAQWQKLSSQPQRMKQIGLGVAIAMLLPVPLTVIAPAEIVALKAEMIAAPIDGVVKAFHIEPNQPVTKGQALFSLDDTLLRNRRDIAVKALAVAQADALAAGQKAFDSLQSKGDLAALQGKVREKEAEVAALDEQLGRTDVLAPQDGVFIYADQNDWIGKPVVTGERIAQLAQPDDLGVLVWVPVGDAISLEPGASMRIYLQVSPLNSLSAELVETSYQATLSPDNIASYRIRGRLAPGEHAHIGLRGVAKIYGSWRPFIYWAMRRPLGALRQWIGL